ncbi:tudor domain-containing 6 [Hypanus sabinus]|uniref:tudor domain-containing 6 n=1 Tax=Hypanus sabinus TaxID=79690 RepID=UPI0028C3F151|nr:tudor domain-containing 6 [Hypanus sabinus]
MPTAACGQSAPASRHRRAAQHGQRLPAMGSTGGLPPTGVCLALRVTRVDPPRPSSVLVRLWGRFQQRERQPDYQRMHTEVQSWAKAVRLGDGAERGVPAPPLEANERCLAEICGEWHRVRVLSRVDDDYTVFMLDEGRALPVRARNLDRGKKEFFHLPPEAVCCILANLVPSKDPGIFIQEEQRQPQLPPQDGDGEESRLRASEGVIGGEWEEERDAGARPRAGKASSWPPGALSFFRGLQGRTLDAQVEAVLPNRLVLVEVARVSRQLCELGLARTIDAASFRLLVEVSTSRPSAALRKECLSLLPPPSSAALGQAPGGTEALQPPGEVDYGLNYFYPLLQLGETVAVRVTHVRYPDRFFCQLRCHCPELERLQDSMHRFYESGRGTEAPRKLGTPCATKSTDGRWYRAIIQHTLADGVLEVFYVDYGDREVVPARAVRRLSPGYFKMPVVTYPFALRDVSDYGRGWTVHHVELLKSLILRKVLQAKVEFYNAVENVYLVTLYQEDGPTINAAFCAQAERLLSGYCTQDRGIGNGCQKLNALQCGGDYLAEDKRIGVSKVKERVSVLKNANLKLNAFYDALVEFVKDPSEFWIRTMETAREFENLMNNIAKNYGQLGRNEGLIKKPEPGLLCCAKFKADNLFYRAVITEILDGQFRVFFIDYGNMEVVSWHDVKALLPEYRKLPALAIKCCLADLFPKEGTWSREAVDYFEKAVFEKHLVVHVLEKEMDKYLIELLDVEDEGEPSINKLIFKAGYADHQVHRISNISSKNLDVLGHWHIPFSSGEMFPMFGGNKIDKFEQSPVTLDAAESFTDYGDTAELESSDSLISLLSGQEEFEGNDRAEIITESPYKQEYLKVGSTVDVQVSFIDEPGDFWCQMTKNTHELKMLMSKIQEYYNTHDDQFQPDQSACIVKYPEDGRWYRALILGKMVLMEVDVLYIDYGNRERVSISDLRAIRPEFLLLKGQAFRCSLYNIIQPMGPDPFMWNEDSIAAFHEFIDNALSLYMELKCTVYALTIVEDKGLCNIVDLNTPFQSACQLLIERGLAKFVGSPSILAPSVSLYTYYYSTHDVKIGSEEEMYVSHVVNPTNFYCLLGRNLGILDKLTEKVNKLSAKMQGYNFTHGIDPICLAKYTDNRWYRALAWPVQNRIRVSFVDYGNKLDVDKNDLLPIPNSAKDVKFLPMQAIKCGLSDIPADLALDVMWFKKAVMDKPLKAVVVAKETDGKLIVELYDGNMQINAKIKEQLCLQGTNETKVNGNSGRQKNKSEKSSSPYLAKSDHEALKSCIVEDQNEDCEIEKLTGSVCKQGRWKNRAEVTSQTDETRLKKCIANKIAAMQTKESSDIGSNGEMGKHKFGGSVESTNLITTWPKVMHVPPLLNPGFKSGVYVSHIISPSHFFVQLSENEDRIKIMEKKLNVCVINCRNVGSFKMGDVCAVFPEDGSPYRAIITEAHNDKFSVEYIDYGNTATVDASKIFPLPVDCLEVQRLSIPCSLAGFRNANFRESKVILSEFTKRTNKTQLQCEFIQQFGQLWEIHLYDKQGLLADSLKDSLYKSELQYSQQLTECPVFDVRPASKFKAYVLSVNSPQQFWCQFKTTEDGVFIESLERNKCEHEGQLKNDLAVKAGNLCMVKSKTHHNWATCEIVQVLSGTVEVLFLKEGIKEVVKYEDLKEITPKFALTYECKLYGLVPVDGNSWSEQATELFKTSVLHKTVTVKVISVSEDNVLEVAIYENLENIMRNKLTASGLGVEKLNESLPNTINFGRYIRKMPLMGQAIEGYITAVESPSYFWCQYSMPEIRMLSEKMREVGVFGITDKELFSTISIGDSCACKYSEDDLWYRAEVKNINGNMLTLQYVDYGNEDDVELEQVKRIPKELLKIPTQCFPCSLFGYDLSKGCWKDGAMDVLVEFSNHLLNISVIENERGKGNASFLSHVQVQYAGGIINDVLRDLWIPHHGSDQVCDNSLSAELLTPVQSTAGIQNDEDNFMWPTHLKGSNKDSTIIFTQNENEEKVNSKILPVHIKEGDCIINVQCIELSPVVDSMTNGIEALHTSKMSEPFEQCSVMAEGNTKNVHLSSTNEMSSVLNCVNGNTSNQQPEDADLKKPLSEEEPIKVCEDLQGSVQSIDLYEEIFKCHSDQLLTEEIGDDSMTRILISHDDDEDYYEDQNLPEAQVNSSLIEDQFVTDIGMNICLEEESKILSGESLEVMNEGKHKDFEKNENKSILLDDPLSATGDSNTVQESSSLMLRPESEFSHHLHQYENEHQDTKSSSFNYSTSVSEKEMVVSEVNCEKGDGQTVPSSTVIELDEEQLIHGTSTEVTDVVFSSTKSDVALLEHFED